MMVKFEIEGCDFVVCAEELRDDQSGEPTGKWRAWCFFAYDRELQIFPADAVPNGIIVQESIVGEEGNTHEDACRNVKEKLHRLIRDKNLEGSGFYSPPANAVYPQEFYTRKSADA